LAKFLVTGVSGCIGAWVARMLLEMGHEVTGADVSLDSHRFKLTLGDLTESKALTLVNLDLRDYEATKKVFAADEFEAVIHLAALQLPFCKADPINGAMVNVVGMVHLLEIARTQSFNFVYASSTAVYGPSLGRPIEENENLTPSSLYGVFKRADEEMSRVYFADHGVASVGLRPWIVYGPGRDQGITADLTIALLNAAKGLPYHIRFNGGVGVEHASEVAGAFIAAALKPLPGARVYTLGGPSITVPEVVKLIEEKTGTHGLITHAKEDLPIACETTDKSFQADYGPFPYMPMSEGIDLTLKLWKERGEI
jgi:UDP-glucuronate 4-epimerase